MKKESKIVVAVDGPAGSGKSSVCRRAAVESGIKYIDSGAIYRAITWFFLEKNSDGLSVSDYVSELERAVFEQHFGADGSVKTIVNGRDISIAIREERITDIISVFSDNRDIRNFVNSLLRKWAGENSIIMDGRDIGTVVFPDADLKVYLDASVDVRTQRRVKDYANMGKKVDENSIRNQIIQRDFNDSSREFGALKKAEGAVYLDTTEMAFDEVIARMKELINTTK